MPVILAIKTVSKDSEIWMSIAQGPEWFYSDSPPSLQIDLKLLRQNHSTKV